MITLLGIVLYVNWLKSFEIDASSVSTMMMFNLSITSNLGKTGSPDLCHVILNSKALESN